MPNEVIVALLGFAGTIIGSFTGIITSSKLTNYRLEQLEKKVDKYNNVIERTYILEEQMKSVNHRLNNLEKGVR